MRAAWLLATVLVITTACAATQKVRVVESPTICAFIGDSCDKLTKGGEGEPGLRWVNPQAKFTQYNKVIVDVVGSSGPM